MTTLQEYIKHIGKLDIKADEFEFSCNGKDAIGGKFRKGGNYNGR
jgi:hypothetical protein